MVIILQGLKKRLLSVFYKHYIYNSALHNFISLKFEVLGILFVHGVMTYPRRYGAVKGAEGCYIAEVWPTSRTASASVFLFSSASGRSHGMK